MTNTMTPEESYNWWLNNYKSKDINYLKQKIDTAGIHSIQWAAAFDAINYLSNKNNTKS